MSKQDIGVMALAVILLAAYIAFAVQSAFGVFSQAETASVTISLARHESDTGGLMDYYACTSGNVQSDCDALYDEAVSSDTDSSDDSLDYYACTYGNVQSDCDALSKRLHLF